MKSFKESKVGIFLNKFAPGILDTVGDVFPPAKILAKLFASEPDIPPADRLEFERLLKVYEENELKAYLADVANARLMQISALAQDDLFSKRFIYFLATGIVFLTFTFDMLMFFVEYPAPNRDMITMVSGVLNSGALLAIVYFFFGSSKGSQDKQKEMNALISNL